MDDNNVEVLVTTNSDEGDMVYEDNSNLMTGLIGLGIGVVGTLLAKKGVNAAKKLWQKGKDKKAAVTKDNENQKEEVVCEATIVDAEEDNE